ncbi:low molecular weight protein-tyrosine-phosphatase [Bacillus sp. 31A1R]|uniref:protein-tyrosine-phosphatase n=1 Tax=Robertmurraya mangrovi TaxID=3098077 RepID=A0ABU5J284_9BACI|nr:low molecular weight protein-tyrosine-phosphatase [Bacillus sp. 31A1R]MDZ5473532.1 low molecular weight protein-tyrosine-phosphatase [Bacillus sp. 31A1R]
MIKVLFVCLGNICRSPMAEAMFRDTVKREGLEHKIIVDSAGTGDWHIGNPPHKGTQDILLKNNISFDGLKARQIVSTDLVEFDYIIAMDTENKKNIEKLKEANPKAEVLRLLDLLPHIVTKDVPDPYFTGNFQEVFDLLEQGCKQLLEITKERI